MLGPGPVLRITCGVGFAILTRHAEDSCYMQSIKGVRMKGGHGSDSLLQLELLCCTSSSHLPG